ncbi:hypothetical protein BJA5080_05662 [Bradyrhizobium diazoefficiens SEMIA 5080]|uniref:Uncharacterized protein n=2 Tax=Bradyrhizobium diazoefficiens TaxID=1355477 RepID=A0A837C3X3_9BRAD|nr:hypothetical protein BJA5080_05662 [Bradyrhizobium diazoefficiens SEMIA 5080]
MNPVEIAHGDHGAPGDRGIRRGVADNGKMRGHQGKFSSRRDRPGPWRDPPGEVKRGEAAALNAISILRGRRQLTRCLTPWC